MSIYAPRAAMGPAKTLIRATLDEHRRMSGSPLSPVTSLRAPDLRIGSTVTLVVSRVLEFGVLLSQVRARPSALPPLNVLAALAPHPAPRLSQDDLEVGFMHFTEVAPSRKSKISEMLCEGSEVTAMVVDIDSRGRGKLSVRCLLKEGEDASLYIKRPQQPVAQEAPADAAAASPALEDTPLEHTADAAASTTPFVELDSAAATQSPRPAKATTEERATEAAAPAAPSTAPEGSAKAPVNVASAVATSADRDPVAEGPERGHTAVSSRDTRASERDSSSRSSSDSGNDLSGSSLSRPVSPPSPLASAPPAAPSPLVVVELVPSMFEFLLPGLAQVRRARGAAALPLTLNSPQWLSTLGLRLGENRKVVPAASQSPPPLSRSQQAEIRSAAAKIFGSRREREGSPGSSSAGGSSDGRSNVSGYSSRGGGSSKSSDRGSRVQGGSSRGESGSSSKRRGEGNSGNRANGSSSGDSRDRNSNHGNGGGSRRPSASASSETSRPQRPQQQRGSGPVDRLPLGHHHQHPSSPARPPHPRTTRQPAGSAPSRSGASAPSAGEPTGSNSDLSALSSNSPEPALDSVVARVSSAKLDDAAAAIRVMLA